jgi:hypothetical protein
MPEPKLKFESPNDQDGLSSHPTGDFVMPQILKYVVIFPFFEKNTQRQNPPLAKLCFDAKGFFLNRLLKGA